MLDETDVLVNAAKAGLLRTISIPSDAEQARTLAALEDADGRLQVLPGRELAALGKENLDWYTLTRGVYGLPSVELLDRLRRLCPPDKTIEIGAGNGVFGRNLGLRMTDNFCQVVGLQSRLNAAVQQPSVRYGADVEQMDALTARRVYKPKIIFGSWVTHRYRPDMHELGGNEDGIDELALFRHIDTYVVYGNDKVHDIKVRMLNAHRAAGKIKFDFTREYNPGAFFSRARVHNLNCLMIWKVRR